MDIATSDGGRILDVGEAFLWETLSVAVSSLLDADKSRLSLALEFLETGVCLSKNAVETARQFNLIRDGLAGHSPQEVAALDIPGRPSAWIGSLSPVVTSCSNMFITPDGEDLLYEIVKILVYAGISGSNVNAVA